MTPTQRHLPFAQFSSLLLRLRGGRFAKFRRGLQGGPYPVRAVAVALLNHPR